MHRWLSVSLLINLGALGLSCKSSEFSGAGGQKTGTTNGIVKQNQDLNQTDTNNLGNSSPGTATGTPVGYDNTNNAVPNTGGEPAKAVTDVLGVGAQNINDVVISQPSQYEVEFGGPRVFRLGDSKADQSACLVGLNAYDKSWKLYYFEFEVTQDATQINASIGLICGIDYNDTNAVSLVRNGSVVVPARNITMGSTNFAFLPQTLPVGRYGIIVESRNGSRDTSQGRVNPNDFDDYIIGHIRVVGSKPIRPGQVGVK